MKYLNPPGANLPAEIPRPGYPPAFPTTQSGEPEELNLAKYLAVLRKNLWVIGGIVLCSTLVAALVSFRSPKVYEAVAKLNVERESPQILSFKEILSDNFDYEMYIETQIRILQSNTLALKTLQDLRLASQPGFMGAATGIQRSESRPWTESEEYGLVRRFLGNLLVIRVRGSQIVEIRYRSYDPQLSAQVSNKLAQNFIEYNLKGKYEATIAASTWLAGQLEDLKRRVEKSEEELVAYERANQILLVNAKEGRSTTFEKLSDVNRQLTQAEMDRNSAESRWRVVQQQGNASATAFVIDSVMAGLQARFNEVSQQLAEAQQQYDVNHPKYMRLKAQKDQLQADLERERQRLAAQIEAEYKMTLTRERSARQAYLTVKSEAEDQNDKSIHYNILKREVEGNRQLYDGLLQRLKEAGISAGLRSSNIQLVDAARAPVSPILPRTRQNIMLGLMAGLIMGLIVAFVREYVDNTIKTPDDVEQYAGLPNLGVIPGISPGLVRAAPYAGYGMDGSRKEQLEAGRTVVRVKDSEKVVSLCRPETVSLDHPHSAIAESFRALGTALLLANSGMPPRAILVTSGLPSEGKTTIAVNVAITLAQRGGRVILVDSDLRRPAILRHLRDERDGKEILGLSHYLTGNATLEEVTRSSDVLSNLDVIFAGAVPPNPAELCSSGSMRTMIRRLREEYSHVLIDSPPLLSVTDATILSVQTDGVLLVSRSGFSTRDSLRRSKRLLEHVNARLLGVVLNDLNLSVDGYYYYYYYGYYGYGRPEKGARNPAAG